MPGAIYNRLTDISRGEAPPVNKHQAINLGENMIKASELFFEGTSS